MAWQRVAEGQEADPAVRAVFDDGRVQALMGFAERMRNEVAAARREGGPAHSEDYIAGLQTAAAQADWDAAEIRRHATPAPVPEGVSQPAEGQEPEARRPYRVDSPVTLKPQHGHLVQNWSSVSYRDAAELKEQLLRRARSFWRGQRINVELPAKGHGAEATGRIFVAGQPVAMFWLVNGGHR